MGYIPFAKPRRRELSDWIAFCIPYRGHIVPGEYRFDGRLICVRDRRGATAMRERGSVPVMQDARALLLDLINRP